MDWIKRSDDEHIRADGAVRVVNVNAGTGEPAWWIAQQADDGEWGDVIAESADRDDVENELGWQV